MRHLILLFASLGTAMALVGLVLSGDGLLSDDQQAEAQTVERPNIVFVMTDDLDERSMQDLDGIRSVMNANGTTFQNAYVTYSLCCPSRATILRGQYPHNHEIIGNGPLEGGGERKFRQLGRDQSTIATWLKDAGYQTGYIGKYMNTYADLYVPPGWDEWFVVKQGPGPYQDVNSNGQWTTLGGLSTQVFANKTSDFIRSSSANPEPFFALVGTIAPHIPPEVADRYKDRFATTALPKSLNFNEEFVDDKPAWVRSRTLHSQTMIDSMEKGYRDRLRSMLSVEDLLRQTIATLQETGELDNTYIFFTSDNGWHYGNHRLGIGKRTPYEEDIGVPLIVRGPGVPAGAVRQQLVLNNDFAPTIADLAGVSTPAFVDGSSFAPLLTGSPPPSWRSAFLEEGWFSDVVATPPPPTHKSVHTKKYMFTEYDTGEYELYDLSVDPYQLQSKPLEGNEQLYSELQARLNALRACSGAGCRNAEGFPDTIPPKVMSTSPATIATTANVTATFSEDMDASTTDGDPSTITATTFKLVRLNADGTTTRVTAAVSYAASTKKAILNPSTNLSPGATYQATVTSGAQDLAGNALDQKPNIPNNQRKSWQFTVQ